MEFLNRIDLRGVVGRSEVNTYNGSQVCNFSVVTEYSTASQGASAIETTWFNVSAWGPRDGIAPFVLIQKGCWVEVRGRIRLRKYTSQSGEERTAMDILAREVKVLTKEDDPMQPQRDM